MKPNPLVFRLFLLAAWGLAGPAAGERIHLEYTAEVQTVVGTPFGLTVPRLTTVTGCFGYDTDAPDSNPSPQRGDFRLAPGGYFQARFLGHLLQGSGTPFLQVEDLDPDTFRFLDGEGSPYARTMRFDGTPDEDFQLQLAITDATGAAFQGDHLPSRFPFPMGASGPRNPHTFSLQSGFSDRLLLQFTSLVQVPRPTLQIRHILPNGDRSAVRIEWISVPGERYQLEWSTTGDSWAVARTGISSEGGCTRYLDPLATRFPDGVPAQILYRVRREEPGP